MDGDVTILSLELEGALVIRAAAGARVTIKSLKVANRGITARELSEDELSGPDSASEIARLRGYEYVREEVRELHFPPGDHVVDE